MGISLGRRPAAAKTAALNSHVVHALHEASRTRFTGAIDVSPGRRGTDARLFFFEGGLYAVRLDGYQPPVDARLDAAGALDGRRAALAAHRPVDIGRIAVDRGWVGAAALGTTHQEYVLASLGAVLALHRAKAKLRPGDAADDYCCLPLSVTAALAAVEVRHGRLVDDLAAVGGLGGGLLLRATGTGLSPRLTLAEFTPFVQACGPGRSLDEAAHACGFTRAEAAHLARILVAEGVLAAEPSAAPADGGLVPEAYPAPSGRTVTPEPIAAAVVAEPEAVVAEPEAVPMAPEVVQAPPDEPIAVVEPEPEPPAAPEPLAEPERVLNEFEVAALRGELAAAERWAAELRARIERAES